MSVIILLRAADVRGTKKRKGITYMAEKEYKFESESKTMRKLNDSLAGKTLRLVMDDGQEFVMSFLTGETLLFGAYGEPMRWEHYGALDADETTFMVSFERFGGPERFCDTYVLDFKNWLVTRVAARQHVKNLNPRMTLVAVTFGAIRRDFEDLPMVRHNFTMDLVGKKITWHYPNGFINTHIYYDANYYSFEIQQSGKIDPNLSPEARARQEAEDKEAREMKYDEPSYYVRIKDGMYLICFTENNVTRLNPTRGGGNLVILINTATHSDVCRLFTHNREMEPMWGLSRAYGELEDDEKFAERRGLWRV